MSNNRLEKDSLQIEGFYHESKRGRPKNNVVEHQHIGQKWIFKSYQEQQT